MRVRVRVRVRARVRVRVRVRVRASYQLAGLGDDLGAISCELDVICGTARLARRDPRGDARVVLGLGVVSREHGRG